MLFRILHTLSVLTGPDIFLNICLSKMRRYEKDYAKEKIPVRLWGIKPATFRFVAQCLNQLRHQQRAPHILSDK